MDENNSLDLGEVEAGLAGTEFAGGVDHVALTDSTNTLALRAAQAGVASGAWVADEQTAGRGRGGHQWHSSAGDGLYLSALVRPRLVGADALKLSLAAGVACALAVREQTGVELDLRWPNDMMVRGQDGGERKVGGILTESAMETDGTLSYAVIGMGINLNHRAMPEELRAIASSLRLAAGAPVSRQAVLIAVLRCLSVQLGLMEIEKGDGTSPASLYGRFTRLSTWVRGAEVHVAEGDGYTGVTDGLDRHGLLRVRLADGSLRTVRHGGVRRVGAAGTVR